MNVLPSVTIFVKFPKNEFEKIPRKFSKDLSLKYKNNNEYFYIGVVSDLTMQNGEKICAVLEVRKDETPLWYLEDIIKTARSKEIFFVKKNKMVARKGVMTSVDMPKAVPQAQIVYPFFAVLHI